MAISVGLDQSFLCALEKGRRHAPGRELLEAISQAAGLRQSDAEELLWAWSHDKVVIEAQRAGLSVATQRLVSAALFAAQVLGRDELAGLENTINSAIRNKRALTSLAGQRASIEEEARMN